MSALSAGSRAPIPPRATVGRERVEFTVAVLGGVAQVVRALGS